MSDSHDFTPPNNEEITEILNLFKDSDFEELTLDVGGVKLFVSKRAQEQADPYFASEGSERGLETSREKPVPEMKSTDPIPQPVDTESMTPDSQPQESRQAADHDLIPIKAPMLGIFYRSPEPGAPEFVKEGDMVAEDDTICLIEVMKLFNTVKAGVKGRIVEICAGNNEMVEYGETLFLIDPVKTKKESSAA